MKPRHRRTQAQRADRHVLYQQSVQDVEAEINFVLETWGALRRRPAAVLREDFCGTANTSCEWVRRDDTHRAIGVDLDPEVLDWARRHNLGALGAEQRARVRLLQANVMDVGDTPVDIVMAMNFSYFIFKQRAEMRAYFRAVHASLVEDGILFLDCYGGYDAPRELSESRACEGFTYTWEQASFNPIDSLMQCYIHFELPDGSRLERAFGYHWRLWTLPELRELLLEAGFSNTVVYWEGTNPENGEGDGVFTPATVGDADAAWVCYLVAEV